MFSLEFNNAIQANTKLKRDVKIFHLSVKNANLKVSKNANRYKEKADLKHNALQIYLQRMGLSKVPSGVKEGAQIDIKKMSELLFSDGTGKQAAKFEEFILKAKSSTLNKSGKHLSFLTGPNSVKEAEVKESIINEQSTVETKILSEEEEAIDGTLSNRDFTEPITHMN